MKTIKELIVRDTIFFDLETSGTTIQTEKIVELCAIKYKMDGTTEIMEKNSIQLYQYQKMLPLYMVLQMIC